MYFYTFSSGQQNILKSITLEHAWNDYNAGIDFLG